MYGIGAVHPGGANHSMGAYIHTFDGPYRFLSNFFRLESPITYRGLSFTSTEAAYQAMKCADPDVRAEFQHMGPGEAKRAGRTVELRPDWNEVKLGVMRDLIALKFAEGSVLAAQLLDTGNTELIEGNTWGDTYWGVCEGNGENWLGKLLMERRAALTQTSLHDGHI